MTEFSPNFAIHEEDLWMPSIQRKNSLAMLGKSINPLTQLKENTR